MHFLDFISPIEEDKWQSILNRLVHEGYRVEGYTNIKKAKKTIICREMKKSIKKRDIVLKEIVNEYSAPIAKEYYEDMKNYTGYHVIGIAAGLCLYNIKNEQLDNEIYEALNSLKTSELIHEVEDDKNLEKYNEVLKENEKLQQNILKMQKSIEKLKTESKSREKKIVDDYEKKINKQNTDLTNLQNEMRNNLETIEQLNDQINQKQIEIEDLRLQLRDCLTLKKKIAVSPSTGGVKLNNNKYEIQIISDDVILDNIEEMLNEFEEMWIILSEIKSMPRRAKIKQRCLEFSNIKLFEEPIDLKNSL